MADGRAASSRTRADQKRGQIATRAAALFDGQGYHATTMEDIAAAVGIAKPTLYHYYRPKAEILYAIHEECVSVVSSGNRCCASGHRRGVLAHAPGWHKDASLRKPVG